MGGTLLSADPVIRTEDPDTLKVVKEVSNRSFRYQKGDILYIVWPKMNGHKEDLNLMCKVKNSH